MLGVQMSQITDIRLLGELNELRDSRVREYLDQLLTDASEEIDNAPTDRIASIAIGKRRALKGLIDEIDNALQNFQKVREAEATKKAVDKQKAF